MSPSIFLGNDRLFGGAGEDRLYGDVDHILLSADSGDNGDSFAAARFIGTDILFGIDSLHGGNSDDILYGDAKTFELKFEGGHDATGGAVSNGLLTSIIAFGSENDDIIAGGGLYGGNGDDKLYGDVKDFLLTLQGGNKPSGGALASSSILTFSPNDVTSSFIFGDDDLYGGEGDDQLYGDAGFFEVNVFGGDNGVGSFDGPIGITATDSGFLGSNFIFGDDLLDGGWGDDKLYV